MQQSCGKRRHKPKYDRHGAQDPAKGSGQRYSHHSGSFTMMCTEFATSQSRSAPGSCANSMLQRFEEMTSR